jgi:hypothetical protein
MNLVGRRCCAAIIPPPSYLGGAATPPYQEEVQGERDGVEIIGGMAREFVLRGGRIYAKI